MKIIDDVEYVTYEELCDILDNQNIKHSKYSDELIIDLGVMTSFGNMFNKQKWIKLLKNELSESLIPMDYDQIEERIKFWDDKNKEYIDKINSESKLNRETSFTLVYRDKFDDLSEHINISKINREIERDKKLAEIYLKWRDKVSEKEEELFNNIEFYEKIK